MTTPPRGRPTRAGIRATERIEIVVTTAERQALTHVAQENRQTLAGLVREAVNSFVGDYGDRRVFGPGGTRVTRK